MKKLLLILLVAATPMLGLHAQPERKGEMMEAIKIAFITKKLALTPEEAKTFWPVYNAYTTDLKKLRKENTGDELEWREKSLNLIKKYKPDMVKSIGQDKFNLLLKLEGEFRQEVKKEMLRRREERQQKKNGITDNGTK